MIKLNFNENNLREVKKQVNNNYTESINNCIFFVQKAKEGIVLKGLNKTSGKFFIEVFNNPTKQNLTSTWYNKLYLNIKSA